jgi:methyl-accepting chemotaxis protein
MLLKRRTTDKPIPGLLKNKLSFIFSLIKKAPVLEQIPGQPSKNASKKTGEDYLSLKTILSDLTSTKSILSKMVLMFLLLIIVPVTTIGFISTNTASNNLLESAKDSVAGSTLQTSNYFDVFMEKAKDVSVQILANTTMQQYISMDPNTTPKVDLLTAQQNALAVITGINSAYLDLNAKLLFNSGSVIGDILTPNDMDKVLNSNWYKKVMEADGKPVWVDYSEGMEGATSGHYAVSQVCVFNSTYSGEANGMIIIDVSYKPIADALASINLGKDDSTYLITSSGKVLSGKGESEEAALADRQFVKEVKERIEKKGNETDFFYTKDGGKDYLVSYHKSPNTDLVAVTIVPNDKIVEGARNIMSTTIWTGILFVLAAGAVGFVFSLGMTLALKKIMGVMSKAENGDLTASMSMRRKDEFGSVVTSFNDMIGNIRILVKESKLAAEEVVSSSEKMAQISSQSSRISNEIGHAIIEVASGSANQAAEIETSVKNVSLLADRISLAVEKTHVMEADSESMIEISHYGLTTIDSLNRKSVQTNEITASVVKEIEQLNQYVKNINVITKVLRGIADQTNLLALNAAIEAARAGNAGKGFAVVAEEIRKLAEQSNSRTREIQKHIENIFQQAQSSTLLVGKAEASIMEQSEMVAQTAEAFSRINKTTAALAENINKVGNMITEMDSNKEVVLSSMENISAVSEQVSASAQEVSASTQEQLASIEQLDYMAKQLNELAANLIRQMEKFTVQS